MENLLIIVNSGPEAAYVVAFMAKQLVKVERVTIFYGPQGVRMAKRGTLAGFKIEESVKRLIADQLDGVSAAALPDDLEGLARYLKGIGVEIASCGTFHVIDNFAEKVEDTSGIEDFITPLKLPQAAEAPMEADKILYY